MSLAKALVAAQKEMKNPAFDSTNPHFRNKFASLASVREAVLPVLNKHGLALSQFPTAGEGVAGCRNILIHEGGEKMEYDCFLPLSKNDPQGAGSAITYARRYSLQAIAGVVAEEDDDANAASEKPKASAKPVTLDTWDKLDPEEQKWLQGIADCVRAELESKGPKEAFALLEEQGLSADHKVALWSRFDSKERAALKKAKEAA